MEFNINLLNCIKYSGKEICLFSKEISKLLFSIKPSIFNSYSLRSYYFWRENKRPIPLPIILKIMNLKKLESIVVESFSIGSGNKIYLPKEDKFFFYFLGLLLGDGCLSHHKRGLNKNTYLIQISFASLEEAKFIEPLIKKMFGVNSSIYLGKGCYNLTIHSKPLVLLLHNLYKIPLGEKYEKLIVPKIVFHANPKLIKFFIKGLFESDGNVYNYRKGKSIQLRQHSKIFLDQVYSLLQKIDLVFNPPYFDKANNSWVLWTSKRQLVDNFINEIIDLKIDASVAQPG